MGKEEVIGKEWGKNSRNLVIDLAEVLFGMLKVLLLIASPHSISLWVFFLPFSHPLYSASVWV